MRHQLLIVGLAVAVMVVGCDTGPTGPRPHAGQYSFYGQDDWSMGITRLNPSTCALDTVADTFMYFFAQTVSADGRYLIAVASESLVVYSIANRRVERVVHVRGMDASCSPDGRLMAVTGRNGVGLTILNLPGYDTRYTNDSLNVSTSVFSHDSRTVYCLDNSLPRRQVVRIRIVPTMSVKPVPTPTIPGALIQVVPSVDEKLLFLYSTWSWDGCSFGVWDVAGDSLIYLSNFSPGFGWIAVSPDGRNVFYTNAGNLHIDGTLPPSAFFRYDIATNSVEEISTRGLANDSTTGGDFLPIGPLAITPDGRSLVGIRAVVGADAVVYDIRCREITNYCYFNKGNNKTYFYSIFCQTGM